MIRALAIALFVSVTPALVEPAFAQPAPMTADDHYQASKRYYDVEEYDKAIAELKIAYTMAPDPAYLFNIAQAMRKKGDCVGAISYYEKYLAKAPDAPNRTKVEGAITELESCAKTQPKGIETKPVDPKPVETKPVETNAKPKVTGMIVTTPPPIEPHDSPRDHKRLLRIGGLVTAGVGAGGLIAGTVFGLQARNIAHKLERDCNDAGGCDWGALRSEDDRGRSSATLSKVMFGAGTALIAGGVVMYVLGRASGHESPVALVPTSSGGFVVTGGQF